MLEDIAILTGGRAITEDLGVTLESVKLDDLGTARKVTIDKDNTTIVEGAGSSSGIAARVKQLRAQVEATTSDYDREKLQERLAKLVGGVAIIKVGAATETEMKEKKGRVEDAMHATRAAVEEGIVPGGGVALLRASRVLTKLRLGGDRQIGVNIIARAIEEPMRWIATNAGHEGSIVVQRVREMKGSEGFNALTDTYEDLVKAGVIDPAKVVRSALQNASSIASLLLTTAASVSEYTSESDAAKSRRRQQSSQSRPSSDARPSTRAPIGESRGAASRDSGAPPPPVEPPGPGAPPPPPPEDPVPPRDRRVNFWISEQAGDPERPLEQDVWYTANFNIGAPVRASLLKDPSAVVPDADVPAGGLPTTWVVTVAQAALRSVGGGPEVRKRDARWVATFPLLLPVSGDSETVQLGLQLSGPQATVHVAIFVRDTVYREFVANLRADGRAPGVETDETQVTPTSQTLIHYPHEWTTPSANLTVIVAGDNLAAVSGSLPALPSGGNTAEINTQAATLTGEIKNLREAADGLRAQFTDELNAIDGAELMARLRQPFQPQWNWDNIVHPPIDPRHEAAWQAIAKSPELRQLAFYGRQLYDAFFSAGSDLRAWLDAAPPGAKLSFTWREKTTSSWIPSIPWTLLYCGDVGGNTPIDPLKFWGLRFRIVYAAYKANDPSRALGDPRGTWSANLLYHGEPSADAIAAEAAWQRAAWAEFSNGVIVPADNETNKTGAIVSELDAPTRSPTGVLYIFCQTAGPDANPVLRFGAVAATDLVPLIDMGTKTLADHPLVFVNACSTAASDPYVAGKLESSFFKRQCRAFIGTECRVPVPMASRLAAVFFRFFYRLIDPAPLSAGEALGQSRLFLWSQYKNIGGLFYTCVNQYDLYLATEAELQSM
jgi:hypothetical protein